MRRQDQLNAARTTQSEQVRTMVPCSMSPTGRHPVTLIIADDGTLRHLSAACELDRALADALTRIGGQSCKNLTTEIRRSLKTGDRYMKESRVGYPVSPTVMHVYTRAIEAKHSAMSTGNRPHVEPQIDETDLLLKLMSKWASKAAGIDLIAGRDKTAGNKTLRAYGGVVVAFQNPVRNGLWELNMDAIKTLAKGGRHNHGPFVVDGKDGSRGRRKCTCCNAEYSGMGGHLKRESHAANAVDAIRRAVQTVRLRRKVVG